MKEVIILGLGPTSVECPFDSSIEIWSCNNWHHLFPDIPYSRVAKTFYTDKIRPKEIDIEELREQHIVAPRNYDGLNIEIYPMDEVLEKFKTKFFSNTICYMLAYALLKGYERIWFYGIDMLQHTTYIVEKGGVEYWMGIAQGLGVPIINTQNSATGKTIDGRMYGDWDNHHGEELSEELSQATRDLIQSIPGLKDLSEEWVLKEGNWVRREQRVVNADWYQYQEA